MSLNMTFQNRLPTPLCIQIVLKLRKKYLLHKADVTLHILLTLLRSSNMDLQSVNDFMHEGCAVIHPNAPWRRKRKNRISNLALHTSPEKSEV